MDRKTLIEVFNHAVLPPRLPGAQPDLPFLNLVEQDLVSRMVEASRRLQELTRYTTTENDCFKRSLERTKVIHVQGRLDKTSLLKSFNALEDEILIIHVTEQNAGLLIYRDADSVKIEGFEASAVSADVLKAHTLQWNFPGCAVVIPKDEFEDSAFQKQVASFLEKASTETVKRFGAQSMKSGVLVYETRDTADPALVTQFLMTMFEVKGHQTFPPLLQKRVRDEVNFNKGFKPWRRSPFWLVVRVGIQRHLYFKFGAETGRVYYKYMMCLMLNGLMTDCLGRLDVELVVLLKTKICRRLAKLDTDRLQAVPEVQSVYEDLSRALSPLFQSCIVQASEAIQKNWDKFKSDSTSRKVSLRWRADPRDLKLSLQNSGAYLHNILSFTYRNPQQQARRHFRLPGEYDSSSASLKKSIAFAQQYTTLAAFETTFETDNSNPFDSSDNEQQHITLAAKISTYMHAIGDAYDSSPEQKSTMLLTIMELWMKLDQCAITLFPLIKDFETGFPSDILDSLQVSSKRDMDRLQKIRSYLLQRYNGSRCDLTIFANPTQGCFAERYFDKGPESDLLQEAYQEVEQEAAEAKNRKEHEWQMRSAEYENLVREISLGICFSEEVTNRFGQTFRRHRLQDCTKCQNEERRASFGKIKIHEHPLPVDISEAKCVIFERNIPKLFAQYRDTTWGILTTFALPKPQDTMKMKKNLSRGLVEPDSSEVNPNFALGSELKPFAATHYRFHTFPCAKEDICLPNGMRFRYYDKKLDAWSAWTLETPTFKHHCELTIPEGSPLRSLPGSVIINGASSYQIIANQSRCPLGMNVHEFTAFQSLLSGKVRRWPQILVELGSSNLNFSTESTTFLISFLALQVGPTEEEDSLGVIHRIFLDDTFSTRLLEQLNRRFDGISSNWHETNSMETLITLTLKLVELSSPDLSAKAVKMLENIRVVTLRWVDQLRTQLQESTDSITSGKCSRYMLWAALLCKRTFAVDSDRTLGGGAMRVYVECAIAVQDNISDPRSLPLLLRNALIRDIKMTHRMKEALRTSLEQNPDSLISAISSVWSDIDGGSSRASPRMGFLHGEHEWWFEILIDASQYGTHQSIHFHCLEGHLLINHKPFGILPMEYRNLPILQELFGDQNLLTYPSFLVDMNCTLSIRPDGHQLHLGFRNGGPVIKAIHRERVIELVGREMFRSSTGLPSDLPAHLLDNCFHWLDPALKVIEIRRVAHKWSSNPNNWFLDLKTNQACRRNFTLVDPHSMLFDRVAQIFKGFELPSQLTVVQPKSRTLTVELNRKALKFFVNGRNLLESAQLRSEIDPNQDAGTWYGLKSKLVLRGVTQSQVVQRQRSIIVPVGDLKYRRSGPHVEIGVDLIHGGTHYVKFTINEVLGRIDCPAETKLLFLKAQFHAFTSFVLPDSLTGRTGTEEALHCLSSGLFQAWGPIASNNHRVLKSLASLTPLREYYPKDRKVMQFCIWNDALTTYIQHDGFRTLIESLLEKSHQLSVFSLPSMALPLLDPPGDTHLTIRSVLRRESSQRTNAYSGRHDQANDSNYVPRDRLELSLARKNIVRCSRLVHTWPSQMDTPFDLAGMLQNWSNFGGHHESFDNVMLSDVLDVEFSTHWGSLVNFCRDITPGHKYDLMFSLSLMSFRSGINLDIIQALAAFGIFNELKILEPPPWSSYAEFKFNETPRLESLLELIDRCLIPYPSDERSTLEFNLDRKTTKRLEKKQKDYERVQDDEARSLLSFLMPQWPCSEPTLSGFPLPSNALLDTVQAMQLIRCEWERLHHNFELSQYLIKVQEVLNRNRFTCKNIIPPVVHEQQSVYPTRCKTSTLLSLRDLLVKNLPLALEGFSPVKQVQTFAVPTLRREFRELQKLVESFSQSESVVRRQYGIDLAKSLGAFRVAKTVNTTREPLPFARLPSDINVAQATGNEQFRRINEALQAHEPSVCWLRLGGLWPCITPVTLLETIRSISSFDFGGGMRAGIIAYAISLTVLQRLLRIEDAHQKGDTQKINAEQSNRGHIGWNPTEQADWLLLELDANLLIRPGQVDVAKAIISPSSGANSVMQFLMGQGKTSVIMPMVAAVLADTKSLLRVIVPKALLLQTAQLLHARLGGLVGRELRHIPFSRKTPTDLATIGQFKAIHEYIQQSAGVMLALPEHILSFKLSGFQRLADAQVPEAKEMIQIQTYLSSVCRDVMDESDYILALKTQLIYPSGSQKTVDGHPNRWELIETLLDMVRRHLHNLKRDFPHSISIAERGDCFPTISFLRQDAEDALVARLVDDIYRGRTPFIPKHSSKFDLLCVKCCISEGNPSRAMAERLKALWPEKPVAKNIVYHLRGLFVHRILLMALKKRWNVQYGLSPTRDPIAVPYLAKGTPSEQSEWGHPDVAIIFTCLSFYSGGLSLGQLREALENVAKSDDPGQEYDRFSQTSRLPGSLRDFNSVNINDEIQVSEIWKYLRAQTQVVDYFLNNFVFPKHAKQFQVKLQASGWDLPLDSKITTGFSGTNDWKGMLPLNIEQHDLPGLAHTNAEVLSYLLQKRNREYIVLVDPAGKRLSETGLLGEITRRGIRILIDAGAQILEMDNKSLAKEWLKIYNKGFYPHEALAAVYFDQDNTPIVMYREGRCLPLLATPFAEDLTDCLVYLDEAHTRGTDLKLPANAKGAVTLGLGQTKDHTVQAAMRMRQLATTQTIVFFAPPEVDLSILDLLKKDPSKGDTIDSYDVIFWLLEQTCGGIEQLQPLYYSQGQDYCLRSDAVLSNPDFVHDAEQRATLLDILRQPEQQTLQRLYGMKSKTKGITSTSSTSAKITGFRLELTKRRKAFTDTGSAVHSSALQEVEQEREVAVEVQTVREVQEQVHYDAWRFPRLHRDIEKFARTGRLTADSAGYELAFEAIAHGTTIGRKFGLHVEATTRRLFVSVEFMKTTKIQHDNFQRQANWILWSESGGGNAMILIPEEAEEVMRILREADSPAYLLTYSAPVTRKMLHFNKLDFYTIPSLPEGWKAPEWLVTELGIFAGRIYFEYEDYNRLCEYTGTKECSSGLTEVSETSETGFAFDGGTDARNEDGTPFVPEEMRLFTKKPLSFLQEWLAIRRKGQDFTHTPMGHLCQGKPLAPDHPFFGSVSVTERNDQAPRMTAVSQASEAIDDDLLDDEEYGHVINEDDKDDYQSSDDEGSED